MKEQCQNLIQEERKIILFIRRIFEDLFDGTLVTWNNKPLYLELKYDEKPVWSCTYPVPRVHEDMFRNQVNIIVSIRLLKHENELEWGAPYFAQPKSKKTGTISEQSPKLK